MAGGRLACPASKAQAKGRTLLFVDEASCFLLPVVTRTDAPVGQTPELHAPRSDDHLSTLGAVTPGAHRFTHMHGSVVVVFLRQPLRQVRGKLLVIWDGAPIHCRQLVKDFRAASAARRLHLERLPASGPELKPGKGVWDLRKRGERKHRCGHDLSEPRWDLGLAIRRLCRRTDRIVPYVRHAALLQQPVQRAASEQLTAPASKPHPPAPILG